MKKTIYERNEFILENALFYFIVVVGGVILLIYGGRMKMAKTNFQVHFEDQHNNNSNEIILKICINNTLKRK